MIFSCCQMNCILSKELLILFGVGHRDICTNVSTTLTFANIDCSKNKNAFSVQETTFNIIAAFCLFHNRI